MYQTLKPPFLSASTFLSIARFFADDQGTSLLYSGGCLDSAQRSYLGIFPFETIAAYGHAIHHQKGKNLEVYSFENPWEGLQECFFKSLEEDPEAIAFGWFGYGMGAFADSDERLPYHPSSLPDAFWQRCAVVLDMNGRTGETVIRINLAALEQVPKEIKWWIQRFSTLEGWQSFLDLLPQKIVRYESKPIPTFFHDDSERRATYINKVDQARELIRAGEIYQVNLSHLFEFESNRHPFSFFHQMCDLNPAPFSAYFRHKEGAIVSTSPERFLRKTENVLESRPIKGTMRRGQTKEEDERLKERLLKSCKERAELVMITDLIRNDLGKISEVGTVQTLQLWRCEAYTNVFHLLSIIQSIVKPGLTSLEIIRACFPGGSITGCPKLRAMTVIDDLERRARGIYTGSLGYIKGQGDFDLNIAIRTLVKEGGKYFLQLGSGIVTDSDPNLEYEETIFKGDSLFQSLQTEEIICD